LTLSYLYTDFCCHQIFKNFNLRSALDLPQLPSLSSTRILIQCEYIFPLNEDGVITHLLVQFDDVRELTAKVVDKRSAMNKYSSAISAGHSAILSRTNERDKMILNIGNLPQTSKAMYHHFL
jgi:hypothetical protein